MIEIDTVINDADTFFPNIDPDDWDMVRREAHTSDARNRFHYAFVTYLRRNN